MILRDKLQPYAVVDLKQDFSRFDDPVSAGPDSTDFGISVLQKLTGQIARVSISHDGDYSTAVCMAAEEATPGDVGGEAQAREGP
jgi:holo-[acyl-carrier protein] synthase